MTPSVELTYSHDYAQRLYRGSQRFTEAWQDLVNRGEVFERVFHDVAPTIVQHVVEVTGYAWPHNDALPLYLVADGDNLVAPLTLVVTDDPEQMLYDTITLLVRHNLQRGFPTDQTRDAAVHAVVREVIRRAGMQLEDAIAATELLLREKHGMDFSLASWDLQTRSARSYLEP